MNTQTLKYETQANAASKDLQTVSTTVAVNYHVPAQRTPEIYRSIGLGYEDKVIKPTIQEAVKAVTAQFTAPDLISNREEVRTRIHQSLKERMEPRGIIIEDMAITNFDFSDQFNAAIEAKVTSEQTRMKAENDLLRIKVEAEQKVATAEGEAAAKVANAKAEAEALRVQREQITPEMLELRRIEVQKAMAEKWNGQLPKFTGAGNTFLQFPAEVID